MKSKCAVLAIALAAMVGAAADSDGAARLQALVDAAAAPGVTGVADIPPGVYELERPLVVTNWVSLALHPRAVLRAAADMDFLVVWDGKWKRELEDLWRRDNRFITGGVLDGAGRASCLLLTNCWHFTLRDVAFYNGSKYGMLLCKGNEVFGTGLTFRTRMPGLDGNTALRVDASDNHFTDVVAIDYTTGIHVDWGANRLTRCHVWNASLHAHMPDAVPAETLERTVAFRIDGGGHILRDCYADTAKIGYLIGGKDMRLFGCSYYNNMKMSGLDGLTAVKTSTEKASALILGGSFVKCAPHMKLEEGPGRIVWRDCIYPGWGHVTVDDVVCEGVRGALDFAARPRPSPLADYFRSVEKPGSKAAAKAALASVPEVVYVTHAAFRADHHNTATLFQCGEINERSYDTQGALKAWNPATGATRVIVPEKEGRTIRDPEVDWDGRRIVFSMRDGRADDYHVYVVNADGTDLRQLTRAKGVSDIDPVFLPDGDIVFSSTRDPKYCMCNRHIMCNLYRMEADGANIHQIGVSTLFEGHSSILPDGRVLYDRWEYVDRDFGDAQGLWTCNPDGTRHAVWWGNNTTSPGGVINARAVGGDSSKAIAILGSCHDRPWGALGLIDRSLGVDGQEPVLRTWPASYRERIHAGGKEDFDSSKSLVCKYADPFPIDESHFLAVRQTGRANGEMSLVYLDLDGNETEILADAPGIWSPVILRPTKKPVVQSQQRSFDAPNAPGTFYLQNVYIGTHMQGVKPGTVKALRVVESPPKRNWTGPRGWFGHGEEAAAMNWHSFENKRILGTVPVESDGSAYFEVPGNTFVYFQALDAEGKMVHSMRSGVNVQPGETYGCVGCHEKRVGEAAPVTERPLAMQRAPSKMNGWYGPTRLFSFQKEVQPVLTKHCVSCHDYGKKAGNKLNLSGDRGAFFCTSYVDLWATGAIKCIGGGPAEIQPAYSWGSHASKLTRTLYGHGRAKLSDEERDRVITWMDINAVYYPRYETAYPDNPGGRMPLSFKEKEQLEKLCGVKIENSHSKRQREQLNFDRPELSRILDGVKGEGGKVKGEKYQEALAIIKRGAERLKATPRGDVEEGFTPCVKDRERDARSERRQAEERRVYEAIRAGRKVYDE